MKVPLEHEPFSPVSLTENQEDQLKWLSEAILDETYAEYEEFVTTNNRVLEKSKWKHVMSRENVAIHKRVGKGELGGCTPDVSLDRPQLENRSMHWKMPGVLGVGSLTGSLDDLLYGIVATTKTETDIRTTYIKDGAGDSRVIANVVHPTEQDPLQALLVRWSLVHQLVHKLGATPRDVVNMESVGSRVLPTGERMGYVVIQSVDLPECGELKHLGIIRLKFSTCYILRDVGNNTVELYMRAFLNPGGRLSEGIAVFTACSSLVAVWRVLLSGQNKKLSWMIRRAVAARTGHPVKATDVFALAKEDNTKDCPICEKSMSGLRSSIKCDICLTKVCSRCIDKRKLTHATNRGKLMRVTTRLCKTCVTRAAQISSRDVAVSEHVPWWARMDIGNSGLLSSPHSMVYSDLSFASTRASRKITLTDTNRSGNSYASTELDDHGADYDSDASLASLDAEYTPRYRRSSVKSVPIVQEDDEAAAAVDPHQLDMWIRINQLRVAAEETYLLTKQNTGAMLQAQEGGSSRGYQVL